MSEKQDAPFSEQVGGGGGFPVGEPVGASVRSRQLGFFHRHRGCLRQRLDFFLLLVMVSFSSSHTLTYVGFGVVGAPVGSWVGTVGEPVGATVCSRHSGLYGMLGYPET